MSATTKHNTTLAKPIAAEDLRRGDYVALQSVQYEYPSFCWDCESHLMPPEEPVRIRLRPHEPSCPLRVVDLCVPFVFVKQPGGQFKTLDLRGCQLVRLDERYGKRVWKALKREKHGKNRRRGRK
jgi:hypothetical protein